ncbi:hypothetical protein [Deinococcus sonorensis]|uniref:Uncharacterized protein n=2 Tax=Deinococcus sonorensis TaxID=309891 RepID=A0AAU7U8Y8_9DEIO
MQDRLVADRKVRALAAAGSYGTELAWAGSVPTFVTFERGLLSAQSELRAGLLALRFPYDQLERWRDWEVAQTEAPLALIATSRLIYDPTGHYGRLQKMLWNLSSERLAVYREDLLGQAGQQLDDAARTLGRGSGVPEQVSALVRAREVALGLLYPALLTHLPAWPELEVRLPYAWRATAGLRFPRSVYGLERLYAFGGEEEARRVLLATRGLGLVDQEKRARAAFQSGYYDGAVRLLRDEAARVHPDDLARWTSLSGARRERLSTLIGLTRSPLGPTALEIAREMLLDVREGR